MRHNLPYRLAANLGVRRRIIGELSRLQPCPLVSLNPDADGPQRRSDNQNLQTHLLAVIHLRLGGPVEEFNNVLGHLRGGGRGLILVLNKAVVENTSHTNTSSREVRVEVHARGDLSAGRRLLGVTSQQAEDVVAATVTALDDQAQIGGESTVVGESGSLFVLVRVGNIVGQLSGSHLDLALLVGLTRVLVLLSKSLGLIDGQDSANQCSVRDTAQGVTAGADFPVDLETSAETKMYVSKYEALLIHGHMLISRCRD